MASPLQSKGLWDRMKAMVGHAFVFINVVQAARFGHVGWGFSLDLDKDRYFFGSTDHLWRHDWWDLAAWMNYAQLKPGDENDWWSEEGTLDDMRRVMSKGHHIRYH